MQGKPLGFPVQKRGLTDTRNCSNLPYSSLAQSVERVILVITGKSNRGHQKYGLGFVKSVIFLLSSVGRASISLCTHELVWETHKFGTDFCAVPPHSSLAQSVERVTVNHDVVGSSPTGGAIYVVRKDYYTQKSLIFKDFSCF